MQTFDELVTDLKLDNTQTEKLQAYINELVIILLESIREDNNRNFDETIASLKNPTR